MTTPSSARPGEVLWFAGGLIDRFPDLEEYFLATQAYHRPLVQRLTGADSQGPGDLPGPSGSSH
jgi:hypothetical protein